MNSKNEWFKLGKTQIIVLFIYLFALLVLSFFILLNLILYFDVTEYKILVQSIYGGVASSLLGGSIFYVRKLYKACINLDVVQPLNFEDNIRQIGVFFYFFLRPIFACSFSLMLLVAFKSGISILSDAGSLKYNFFYFHSVVSFLVGYSSGDLIDKLEDVGKSVVSKVSNVK